MIRKHTYFCVPGNKRHCILCADGHSLNVCWLEFFKKTNFATAGCVMSGKFLNLSEFSFLIYNMRIKNVSACRVLLRLNKIMHIRYLALRLSRIKPSISVDN